MLIDFSVENFRVFLDKNGISMKKGLKRELTDKIILTNANNKEFNLLPTMVIYGTNASGKTSLILALEILQEIILTGSIKPPLGNRSSFLYNLPIYHFMHKKRYFYSPMTINISFINNENLYSYEIKIVNVDSEKITSKVIYEKLEFNDKTLFIRENNNVRFNPFNFAKYNDLLGTNLSVSYISDTEELLKNSLDEETVFTSWFKNFGGKITNEFTDWFKSKLMIFNNLDEIVYNANILNTDDNYIKMTNEAIVDLVKAADFGPQKIEFSIVKDEEENESVLLKSYYDVEEDKDSNEKQKIKGLSSITESLGTLKLIKFIGPFIDLINKGGVLLVDELDSSIHPEVIASIIKVFSNPDVNIKGAQLIFTTHNPVFLNRNLFRRDEILFIEKDLDNFKSTISTLDDFEIRGDQRYLKNYLEGRYINFVKINFSEIIKELNKKYEKK